MRTIANGVIEYGPPAGPDVYTHLLASAFWERFTNAELVDYDVAMQHDPAASVQAKRAAARLRIFRRETSDSGSIRIGAQKITAFVTGLEALGVLGAGRAAAILSAPITDEEAIG